MGKIHNRKAKEFLRKNLRRNITPQEAILWSRIRNSKLGVKFQRQHSIGSFIVDFYCAGAKLIIEIDGSQHSTQKEYDNERSGFIESFGYKIMRFKNNEIDNDLEGVILRIERELKHINQA